MSFREKTDGASTSSSRFSGKTRSPHIALLGHRHRLLRDGKQVTVVLQATPGRIASIFKIKKLGLFFENFC
jgi:hypothetical protein